MATLADILISRYPGPANRWKLEGGNDTYAGLTWYDGADLPTEVGKPDEATLRALAASVDAELVTKRAAETAMVRFIVANPDAVLRGFEIVSNCIAAIYGVLSAGQKTTIGNMAGNPVAQFQALQAHLTAMRNGS